MRKADVKKENPKSGKAKKSYRKPQLTKYEKVQRVRAYF